MSNEPSYSILYLLPSTLKIHTLTPIVIYIPFHDIAFEARVWIYQANRNLTDDEVGTLTETLKAALEGWEAHGEALTASGKIFHHRFVVIAVDESEAFQIDCPIYK